MLCISTIAVWRYAVWFFYSHMEEEVNYAILLYKDLLSGSLGEVLWYAGILCSSFVGMLL